MNFVGIDLHKKTISVCVVNQERQILDRKRFYCSNSERIVAFFESLHPFQAVVEATAEMGDRGTQRIETLSRGIRQNKTVGTHRFVVARDQRKSGWSKRSPAPTTCFGPSARRLVRTTVA